MTIEATITIRTSGDQVRLILEMSPEERVRLGRAFLSGDGDDVTLAGVVEVSVLPEWMPDEDDERMIHAVIPITTVVLVDLDTSEGGL